MTGTTHAELVGKAQRLIREKDALEKHIQELEDVLKSQGVGMNEPLTDAEGFPRADIDIYQVRNIRVEVIRLRNDHAALMKDIEKALHEVHAQAKLEGPTTTTPEATSGADLKPLAKVIAVAPDSPSSESGMKRGDMILRFGAIDASHADGLKALGDLVARSEDKSIPLLVCREGEMVSLNVTPHKWNGRGLLGCHLVPS